jgi:alkylation response protein AidB-like acyl-CoA dehydrogenase
MDIQATEHLDLLSRARALAPVIAAASAEIDRRRELLPETVAALINAGFFRLLQPRFLGGAELPPMLFAQVTEILAQADASTAWCVCQNNGCAMSAAYLEPEMAREIFGPPNGILAWGPPGAPFEAQPIAGGYRISGKWRFASGSHHATWLGAHMRVAGTNTVRTMLFPKASAAMNDIWHTIGLRGTASDEYVVEDLFVPANRSILRDTGAERKVDTTLYRFTSNQLYSCGFAGVGLGIARATIKAFLDLPREKVSRGASRPLRENNVVQSQLAQCEARLRSARAFLHTTWQDAWAHVNQSGNQTEEDRAMIRLASTWAIQQAREVVTTLYHAAGSVAVFEDHPFERRLRDIHTVAQQAQGRQLHYETVGQILLDVEQENQF